MESYRKLVDGGGRPSHPLERMEDIISNPGEFREILSFWQDDDEDWQVFSRQVGRWLDFQRVQRLVREGPFMDDRHLFWAVHKETWDDFARQFPKLANGTRGFPEYVQSAKERLARHGFTRPFELDRDIAKQNKLATWIEFMNWEYMWYEQYVSSEKKGQRRHDKAWKTLVESGELKPGETEDELWTFEHRLQRSAERHSAERAVKTAKRDLISAEHASTSLRTSMTPLPEPQRRVEEAQANLAVAADTHSRVAQRNDCISRYVNTTKNYRIAKEDAARHQILLRWMLQQIPLIEQEESTSDGLLPVERIIRHAALPGPAAGGTDPERTPTSTPRERLVGTSHSSGPAFSPSRGGKRSRDESSSDAQPSKKAKRGNSTTMGAPACDVTSLNDQQGTTAASRPVPKPQPRDKRKGHAKRTSNIQDAGHQQASHRAKPRRSARIAEQQKLNSKRAQPNPLPRLRSLSATATITSSVTGRIRSRSGKISSRTEIRRAMPKKQKRQKKHEP